MGKKYVIIVDMQNDFITGSLGSEMAVRAAENAKICLAKYDRENTRVIFTHDTHHANYLETAEGKTLPIPHCILGTEGWEISQVVLQGAEGLILPPTVEPFAADGHVYKPTFGSLDLINYLYHINDTYPDEQIDNIDILGVCTDICVVSNVLLLKAAFPETPINVIADCCAGTNEANHNSALDVMRCCQINVI
jgi:nicotinamidase-related amidase